MKKLLMLAVLVAVSGCQQPLTPEESYQQELERKDSYRSWSSNPIGKTAEDFERERRENVIWNERQKCKQRYTFHCFLSGY